MKIVSSRQYFCLKYHVAKNCTQLPYFSNGVRAVQYNGDDGGTQPHHGVVPFTIPKFLRNLVNLVNYVNQEIKLIMDKAK